MIDKTLGILCSSAAERIRGWDCRSGTMLWTCSAHFGPVHLLAVDSLHGIVFSAKGPELKKWWIQVGVLLLFFAAFHTATLFPVCHYCSERQTSGA